MKATLIATAALVVALILLTVLAHLFPRIRHRPLVRHLFSQRAEEVVSIDSDDLEAWGSAYEQHQIERAESGNVIALLSLGEVSRRRRLQAMTLKRLALLLANADPEHESFGSIVRVLCSGASTAR